MSSASLVPDSESHSGDWTPNTGTRVTAVDEGFPADDSTSYVAEDMDTAYIEYGFESSPGDVDSVTAVSVKIRAKDSAANTPDLDVDFKIGGASQGVDSDTLTGSWATYTLNLPGWDGPWTKAQIDGAAVRITIDQASKVAQVQVSSLTLEITYTPTGGGPVRGSVLRPKLISVPDDEDE